MTGPYHDETRTIVLTGAAGGLGSAIAKQLAKDGHRLILTDIHDCSDQVSELGCAALAGYACDLGLASDVERFIERVNSEEKVDVLINNAAYQKPTSFEELTPDGLSRFLRINVEAPFQLVKGFAPGMIGRGWGRIINVVTGSAWRPTSSFTGYITSKMGLVGMTRSLAHDLGEAGITVNAITPGLTRHSGNQDGLPEMIWEAVRASQAIKRGGLPEDFTGAISFLISSGAAFMTGQTLAIDGGAIHL